MALIDSVRTHADALADFANWTKDYDGVADPLRRAARIMAALAQVMATVIDTQAAGVQALSKRMGLLNEALKQVNAGVIQHDLPADQQDTRVRWVVNADQAVLQRLRDLIEAEGVDPTMIEGPEVINDPNNANNQNGLYELVVTVKELKSIQSTLQTTFDALSSTSQADQARVQTTLGRYNAVFELVSSLIKKSETQGDTVSTNLKT